VGISKRKKTIPTNRKRGLPNNCAVGLWTSDWQGRKWRRKKNSGPTRLSFLCRTLPDKQRRKLGMTKIEGNASVQGGGKEQGGERPPKAQTKSADPRTKWLGAHSPKVPGEEKRGSGQPFLQDNGLIKKGNPGKKALSEKARRTREKSQTTGDRRGGGP